MQMRSRACLTVVFDLQLQATNRLSASNSKYIGNLLCHSFNSIFALRNSVYRMEIRQEICMCLAGGSAAQYVSKWRANVQGANFKSDLVQAFPRGVLPFHQETYIYIYEDATPRSASILLDIFRTYSLNETSQEYLWTSSPVQFLSVRCHKSNLYQQKEQQNANENCTSSRPSASSGQGTGFQQTSSEWSVEAMFISLCLAFFVCDCCF